MGGEFLGGFEAEAADGGVGEVGGEGFTFKFFLAVDFGKFAADIAGVLDVGFDGMADREGKGRAERVCMTAAL